MLVYGEKRLDSLRKKQYDKKEKEEGESRFMHAQMLTSKYGGELVSFKLNDIERIHQGQDCIDDNGKVFGKDIALFYFRL